MPIEHNISELRRGLDNAARRQIPFAVSVGINETLKDVKRNEEKNLSRRLDRPTPFTLRAFGIRRSSKRRLTGRVFAKDIQGEYLSTLDKGGTRQPEGRAVVIPGNVRLNKYGNLPRRKVAKLAAQKKTFATSPGDPSTKHLAGGIYRRIKGGGLQLLIRFADRARYDKRLRFHEVANKTANARLAVQVERAMIEALRTAR